MANDPSQVRQRKGKDKSKKDKTVEVELEATEQARTTSDNEDDNIFAESSKLKSESRQQEDSSDPATSTLVETKPKSKKKKVRKTAEDTISEEDDSYNPLLDILRVITFLLLASCGLSYVMSAGESWTWGWKGKPWYMRADYWKTKLYGPVYLTPEELLNYDGTDPDQPIYLAINHTIYDVSSNPRIYGRGGSYNVFAGHDASRGFVTGCFLEDRTPDMRGVEEMYLPLDDPEIDRNWSYEEMQALRVEERARAEKKVHDALKHWTDFFANSDNYLVVGKVARPDDWLETTPRRPLCESAQKKRTRRKLPHEVEEEERKKQERKERKKNKKKGGA